MKPRPVTDAGALDLRAPAPWEDEESFSDILYDWMSRAPWLGISAALHVVVFMILTAIPWDLLRREEQRVFISDIVHQEDDLFIEEPPEEPVEPIPEEPLEDPVLVDAELDEPVDSPDESDTAALGEVDFLNDVQTDLAELGEIGLGGGWPSGPYGTRFGGPGRGRPAGGSGTEQAVEDGLRWLARHQDPDGKWDTDEYMKHDPPGAECTGAGEALHDVGMTGLALLAFLGDGNTTTRGLYKDNVTRGILWLKGQQDRDTGLFGEAIGQGYMYDHAIASLAICEAYYFSKSPLIKRTAQDAINFITRARNPYSAWRYDYPPTGENDTSVTGWMVFALKSAQEAGLEVDPAAFQGALTWIDEVTDPGTGRVGYDSVGSASSRIDGINKHYPPEKGEAMTAVGLLCRFFLGQDPDEEEIMKRHADLLLQTLPEWDPDGFGCDMYYWYYGTYAMFQMGGSRYWKPWNEAMKGAVVESQRQDSSYRGSWDPVGPWGYAGGRVYSTACMVLCLEVYFRYAKVLGAR